MAANCWPAAGLGLPNEIRQSLCMLKILLINAPHAELVHLLNMSGSTADGADDDEPLCALVQCRLMLFGIVTTASTKAP